MTPGRGRRLLAATIGLDTRRSRLAVARTLPLGGPGLLSATAIAVVIAALLPTAFTVSTGALVGAVATSLRHSSGSAHHHVFEVLIVTIGLFLLVQVVSPVAQLLRTQLGYRITGAMHHRVMDTSLRPVGIGHLENPAVLDLLELAKGAGSAEIPPGRAADGLFGVWGRRLQGWGFLVVVARFSPILALGLVAELSVSYRLYLRGFHAYTRRFVAREEDFRRATYFRSLGIGQEGGKEIRVFGLASWVADRYRQVFEAAMRDLWRRRDREAVVQLLPIALDVAMIAVALGSLAVSGAHGSITVGQLTAYAGAVLGTVVLTALSDDELSAAWGAAAVDAAAALDRAVAALPALTPGGIAPGDLPRAAIVFEHVRFAYPGRGSVFQDLNLTIEAGRSLAIVGDNGAGKTTLVKLLARLYDPDGGRITVDGLDLRDLDPAPWQRRVAAIFQDFIRYEAYSLADNIALGHIEQLGDRDAVARAAVRSGATDVVGSLPAGWESPLGRQFHEGGELSGGQWQRVALARALFATEAGAGVLVLDEPTANLDVRGETEIYDRFLDLTRGVTTIVISHRFSTVRRADRIVVLAAGQVIEDGTHDELLSLGGRYAEMFRLQASHYRAESVDD